MTSSIQNFKKILINRGLELDNLIEKLENFKIATPSWAYSEGGTRFHVFKDKYAATNLYERIEHAGQVHKCTGITPELSIHIPWDKVSDFDKAKELLENNNLKITSINPNLFQNEEYKFGSISNSNEKIRNKAVEHLYECIKIGKIFNAQYQNLWFADGTNFPGQGDFIKRKYWILECLKKAYDKMEKNMIMLLEYKFYEPAFYHTDIPDWGTAFLYCQKLGEKAKVLVDLGHHPHGTNIEFLVSNLIDEGKLGGFHFNSRKYGDDDLTTGSLNLYELFLIFNELNKLNADDSRKTAFMLDQSHNLKPKIQAMIQSVLTAQEIYAKVLVINRAKLQKAQEECNLITAEECLKEAFFTDVKPLLYYFREIKNLPKNPLKTFINLKFKKI
ncbi:MAG: TIM barrel protein [Promethearchaeota archaeon]